MCEMRMSLALLALGQVMLFVLCIRSADNLLGTEAFCWTARILVAGALAAAIVTRAIPGARGAARLLAALWTGLLTVFLAAAAVVIAGGSAPEAVAAGGSIACLCLMAAAIALEGEISDLVPVFAATEVHHE